MMGWDILQDGKVDHEDAEEGRKDKCDDDWLPTGITNVCELADW